MRRLFAARLLAYHVRPGARRVGSPQYRLLHALFSDHHAESFKAPRWIAALRGN